MLAVSTAWCASEFTNVQRIVDEISSYGINSIELSIHFTEKMLKRLQNIQRQSHINVTSMHNYCPAPRTIFKTHFGADVFNLADLNEAKRRKAVLQTKKTLCWAEKLMCPVVVLHLGRIISSPVKHTLFQAYGMFGPDSAEFIAIRNEYINQRNTLSEKHFQQALKSIDELNECAINLNISIGLENRYGFMEIPNLEETEILLEKFNGGNVYYWHDIGHGQTSENMGFAKHEEILSRLANSMIGIHIHDIHGIHDHKIPGRGEFDFTMLKKYLKTHTLKVIESHRRRNARDSLMEGIEYLKSVGIE